MLETYDHQLQRLARDLKAAYAAEEDAVARQASDDELNGLTEASRKIVEQMQQLPAATVAGLKAKADALRWCFCGEFDAISSDGNQDPLTIELRVARSLLDDIERVVT